MQSTSKQVVKAATSVLLTLSLALSAPLTAAAQSFVFKGQTSQAATAGKSSGMAGARVYHLDLPDLKLNSGTPSVTMAPMVSQAHSVAPGVVYQADAPVPALAPSSVISRHPVLEIIDTLQKAGVNLEQTGGRAASAEQLLAAAQSLPEGKARQNMIIMAKVLAAPQNAQGAGLDEAYENGKIDPMSMTAQPVKAEGFWGALSRSSLLPKSWRKSFLARSEKNRVPPATRDLAYTEISADKVRGVPGLDELPESTEEVAKGEKKIVGQDRAMQAILFGLKMPGGNYNLFVSGMDGSGRESALDLILKQLAPNLPTPLDTVAVTNFENQDRPVIISIPSGNAKRFEGGVKLFVNGMKKFLPQLLNSGQIAEFKKNLMAESRAAQKKRQETFDADLAKVKIGKFGISLEMSRTEQGMQVILLPTFNDKTLTQEEVDGLIKDQSFSEQEWKKASDGVQEKMPGILEKFQAMMQENMAALTSMEAKVDEVNKEAAGRAVAKLGEDLMGLVSGGSSRSHDDKGHRELASRQMKREQAFLDEIAKIKVGRFGVAVEVGSDQQSGAPTMYASLTLDGEILTEEVIAAKKVGPKELDAAKEDLSGNILPLVMEKYQALQTTYEEEHAALHSDDADAPATASAEEIKAVAYVQSLLKDAADHYADFLPQKDERGMLADLTERYKVSVLASNLPGSGAPVIKAKVGSHEELFGIAESSKKMMMVPGMGMVKTKEPGGPKLKGGLFHKANGGFLVLHVMDVLREPGAWDALMRSIRNGEAEIVEGGILNPMATGDERHGVPGKVKVVLIGSPQIKMMLGQYDQDYVNHFNAVAEFESELEINADTIKAYVSFFKQMVVESGGKLLDVTRDAMEDLIKFGARLADSNEKVTAQFSQLLGLMGEATFWASERAPTETERKKGRKLITAEDIEMALAARSEREGNMERYIFDIFRKGIFRIDSSGEFEGQINGLAVMGAFGLPFRMTTTMYPGAFKVVSLDQEAGYTGPSFNKARAVVEGFLAHTFAQNGQTIPVEFRVSSEQNYGGIDGDSGTSTMIYGALSKAAGVKISQRFAVTGSADQWGFVQAIGGANQKTEGWFQLASQMINKSYKDGLNAVIIPWTNSGDLMLSPDVQEAVKEGRFKIHRVRHVSEAMELLTGVAYPEILRRAQINFNKIRATHMAQAMAAAGK